MMRGLCLVIILMISGSCNQMLAEQRQYLHDNWTFGLTHQSSRYPAVVPGGVHTDLMRQGLIKDPYIGLNERDVQWVDKEDWLYETTFRVTDGVLAEEHVDLCFDGLDTYADVYLNDHKILEADNMFRRWRIDVKSLLRVDNNVLRVYFHSPIKVDMPKWEKHSGFYDAANDQSENGGLQDRKLSVFARKAGYHYGWDWGPRLVTSGIWRDVYMEAWSKARITDVYLHQCEVSKQKAIVRDEVQIETDIDIPNAVITVMDNKGRSVVQKKCSLRKGQNTVSVDFVIKNPRLWWCRGLGKPERYTFMTNVVADGKLMARNEQRIGLRSVRLVMDPDEKGNSQFYFVLNGVRVFAKGTNYIPQDNFLTTVTPERYWQTLRDAVLANMNMIRVWGGGIYENDIFYDLCDEMGLMVWQDFMFACSTYPAEGDWLESVRQEADDNIRRLRNHPCIVLWCGGNECLDAWYNWGWKGRMEKTDPEGARLVEQQQEHLYYDVLQEITSQLVPDDIYTPGSPYSVRGHGSDGVNGDRHFYGVGHRRMPVSMYNQETSHFFSEYGMQSFPEYASVLRYAPDTTTHDIGSQLMMWHQRGGVEANKVIEWYVNNEYGHPRDFRQFLYASQLLQGDAMRTAIESHRRDMPHCMGSLLWQHNDCWPVASWSTRDYYGHWKAAHYMVRHAFEPLLCSAVTKGDSLLVYAVNDLQLRQQVRLRLTVYTLSGQTVHTQTQTKVILPNTSTLLLKQSLSELLKEHKREDVVVNMSLTASSGVAYEANSFLCLQKDLRLLPAKLAFQVDAVDGGCIITIKSDKFVRALAISLDAEKYWLDKNYFDLLPGVPVQCFLRSSLSPADVRQRMTFISLNSMKEQ